MGIILFRVNGLPASQGSKNRGRGRSMYEADKKLPAWRQAVKEEAARRAPSTPIVAPVWVSLNFRFPRPKTVNRKWPSVKPDIDKITRAVLDAITTAGIWKDDSQVVYLIASKVYAEEGQKSGVDVLINDEMVDP